MVMVVAAGDTLLVLGGSLLSFVTPDMKDVRTGDVLVEMTHVMYDPQAPDSPPYSVGMERWYRDHHGRAAP